MKVTWQRMQELDGMDIQPFGFEFDLLNPVTLEGDICFGWFRVRGWFYRNGVNVPGSLLSVKISADGKYYNVVGADAVTAHIID